MNCVVICCDTFRADALLEKEIETPNLDRLRSGGYIFHNAFGEGLPTIQARRTLFTGIRSYPWRFEMDSRGLWPAIPGWHRIPSEQATLSETLLEAGYTTGFVADTYHMFKPTQNFTRGFASWEFIRGQESDNWRSGPLSKIDVSPYRPDGKNDIAGSGHLPQYLLNMQDRASEEDYLPARVFRTASRWLEDNHEQAPFFLWIDSFAPHEYWDPPREFADRYYVARNSRDYIVPQWVRADWAGEDEVRRTKALYQGYVTFVDKWIGRFLEKLEQLGLREETLLVFTSDHGTELWDRGSFGKSGRKMHRYNAQVPLIIAPPGMERERPVEFFVQHQDITATVYGMLGVEPMAPIDGIDLRPYLRRTEGAGSTATGPSERERIIIGWMDYASVRDREWMLSFNATDTAEAPTLFHVAEDSDERNDVAQKYPDVVREYQSFLRDTLDTELPIPVHHRGDKRQLPPFYGYRK